VSDLNRDLEALRLEEEHTGPGRGRWLAVALAFAVITGGLAWWWTLAADAAPEIETARATVRQSSTPGGGAPILTASGYVVARRKAVVSAKIQGRLSDLRVEEGSRVTAGQIIARLESGDYEAQLMRARARVQSAVAQAASADARVQRAETDLAEARRQMRQAERLAEERVVSADERDAARSRAAVADAALSQARAERAQVDADIAQADADVQFADAQLQNTVIRAPFAGTVVKKMAEVGESVAPIPPGVNISTSSGAIVALADLETLEVEVDVSEAHVGRLRAGQHSEVTVEAFPDKRYRGALRQVIPTADRTKATVMVKVTILDGDGALKPEMSARVTFLESAPERSQPDATPLVLVPQQAIVTRDGATMVFELGGDGRVRVRPVVVGIVQQDQVIVKEGLNGHEVLVNRPPDTLKDGDQVKVKG
jgi:HlyD family secretion protein